MLPCLTVSTSPVSSQGSPLQQNPGDPARHVPEAAELEYVVSLDGLVGLGSCACLGWVSACALLGREWGRQGTWEEVRRLWSLLGSRCIWSDVREPVHHVWMWPPPPPAPSLHWAPQPHVSWVTRLCSFSPPSTRSRGQSFS